MPCQLKRIQYWRESLECCISKDGVKEVIGGVLKRLKVKNDCRSCIAFEKLDDADVSQGRREDCGTPPVSLAIHLP